MTKRIFISADHGMAIIYFLQSDVIPTLLNAGVDVILPTVFLPTPAEPCAVALHLSVDTWLLPLHPGTDGLLPSDEPL